MLRSLFRKEQAPPFQTPSSNARPLDDDIFWATAKKVDAWVAGKGYRMPDRTVESAAARMGTTSNILHRFCLQRYSLDFRSWRVMLRMEDAKKMLLEEPETTASCIGRRVGVSDRSNFLRQFQAYTGYTPDAWRKQQH